MFECQDDPDDGDSCGDVSQGSTTFAPIEIEVYTAQWSASLLDISEYAASTTAALTYVLRTLLLVSLVTPSALS